MVVLFGFLIGVGRGAVAVALVLLFALVVTVVAVVGLSSLGGYLGVELADRDGAA
ncbi:hypothetical protein [Halorientalis sp.]|uniref:hypothetical protein n=1 Tax=Halorientalis sp. TaxID=1931229 RepID=UPI00260C8D22|nr:hypothetical protein [Halorientalis sp.]